MSSLVGNVFEPAPAMFTVVRLMYDMRSFVFISDSLIYKYLVAASTFVLTPLNISSEIEF